MRYTFQPSYQPCSWVIFEGRTQIPGLVTQGFPDPTVPYFDKGYNAEMVVGATAVILWAPTATELSEKIDKLLNG